MYPFTSGPVSVNIARASGIRVGDRVKLFDLEGNTWYGLVVQAVGDHTLTIQWAARFDATTCRAIALTAILLPFVVAFVSLWLRR